MQRLILSTHLLIISTIILFAQQDDWPVGVPIEQIEFNGLASISRNELNGLLRPYIGQVYSDDLSWEIQNKLYSLDYFKLITPGTEEGSIGKNSVVLVFLVQENPVISKVEFIGNKKIRRAALDEVILIKEGNFLNEALFAADEQAIRDLYLGKGFVDAKVSMTNEINEKRNQSVITFTIEEGSQTRISEISFVGNNNYPTDNTLRNLMSTKSQTLFNKGLYVEATLQEDLKKIENYYGDNGYIDAKVVNVEKQLLFDEKEKFNKMRVIITIEEGEQWTFGGMTFNGYKIYTLEEITALITQVKGNTFNLSLFQQDYQRVIDMYIENGYIFNSFSYNEIRNEVTREISYKVEIVERDRAHIENILVRGNTKTKSYVILREFPLSEGEVFSKDKIYKGIINLQNLRFFQAIDAKPYPGSQEGLMDVVIDVSEQDTSRITAGLTFSGGNEFPLSAIVSWSNSNFAGRGQTVGVNSSFGFTQQKVSFQFVEPRMFGNRLLGSFNLSYAHRLVSRIRQDRDFNGIPDPYITWEEYKASKKVIPKDLQMKYDSHIISTGLGTGYTWIRPKGRIGVSSGLQFSWQYVTYEPNVYTPHNYLIRDNLNTWKYSDSIYLTTKWDSRDLQFDPTRGLLISETITWAGILESISNRNYIKSVTRFNWNLLLFDVPIGKKGKRFKSVFSFDSAFSSIFEKPWIQYTGDVVETNGFIVDGMFIGRGWPFNSGEYYKYLWDNTLTVKFPLINHILSFDLFLDAVGAWRYTSGEESALDNWQGNDWRFSMGFGFRFANPQFPIGIYLVKRFQWKNNVFTWYPDDENNKWYEFRDAGLDLVISFDIDLY